MTSLGVSLAGCSATDCECPDVPTRPEPQPPLESLMLVFEDPEPRVVRPAGSLVLTESEVVIEYDAGGAAVHVRYSVHAR